MKRLACLLVVTMAGCASVQRVPLKAARVILPEGRFIGPIEIPVPRHADHDGHDFEIRVTLTARCAPRLTLAFPDGETQELGEHDPAWQDLLLRRVRTQPVVATVVAPEPAAAAPAPETVAAVGVEAAPRAQPRLATVPSGHWQAVSTETWPGQLEFERLRADRCARSTEYTARYLNAFDDTGTLALWADVPQELLGAELRYEIIALVTPKQPVAAPIVSPVDAAPPPTPRPRPPAPAPQQERPADPEDRAATWQPGSWSWVEGSGEWVWHGGYWLAPAKAPALKPELVGAAPNAGATWVRGHWTWQHHSGRWVWQAGRWSPPPPREEVKGTPPGEGAPWNAGYWSWNANLFVWIDGHWGRPPLRVELPPPAPFPGASWIRGDWIQVKGSYVWSPGFYQGAQRPPAPRVETPPPAPGPHAIWLQGYWRWDGVTQSHQWVDGHWELPPGENYIWVADPGVVFRGRWELRLK